MSIASCRRNQRALRLQDALEAAKSAESAVKPSIRRLCEWRRVNGNNFLDNGKGLQRMLLDHGSKMLIQVGLAGGSAS